MKYQETGRLGRITKNLRKMGFEKQMELILFDSLSFPELKKAAQTGYIETIVERMEKEIGSENTDLVLFECGAQCCGRSWSQFAKNIMEKSTSIDDFFTNLNIEESKYHTQIKYDDENNSIIVSRSKCICGLINKGNHFSKNKTFCNCSIGHMSKFFNTNFSVAKIFLQKSIMNGDKSCQWLITLKE